MTRSHRRLVIAFVLPSTLLYVLFFIYPSLQALQISLYDWSGLNPANARFVGLGNFATALDDPLFGVAIRNAVLLVFVGGALMLSLALLFAAALTRPNFRGRSAFQTLIFLPYAVSGAAVGLFWNFVFNPTFGGLNGLLQAIDLGSLARPWLGEPGTAIGAVIFVSVWWSIGFYTIVLVAGISAIPREIIDAARADGADELQTFRHVTLPLISETLVIVILLWIVDALKTFAVVFLLTGGGPAQETQVLTTLLALEAFRMGGTPGTVTHLGYATTLAVILTGLVVVAGVIAIRFSRRHALEY